MTDTVYLSPGLVFTWLAEHCLLCTTAYLWSPYGI